jgi:hypothetical protein
MKTGDGESRVERGMGWRMRCLLVVGDEGVEEAILVFNPGSTY